MHCSCNLSKFALIGTIESIVLHCFICIRIALICSIIVLINKPIFSMSFKFLNKRLFIVHQLHHKFSLLYNLNLSYVFVYGIHVSNITKIQVKKHDILRYRLNFHWLFFMGFHTEQLPYIS